MKIVKRSELFRSGVKRRPLKSNKLDQPEGMQAENHCMLNEGLSQIG